MDIEFEKEIKGLESDKKIIQYELQVSQKSFSEALKNGLGKEIKQTLSNPKKPKLKRKLKYKMKYFIEKFYNYF
jgi:hypothetical protein